MISITSDSNPSGFFTIHIFPSGTEGSQVRGANFDDEEVLRVVLNRCLPKDLIVDKVTRHGKGNWAL
jgi:hypothetical protein